MKLIRVKLLLLKNYLLIKIINKNYILLSFTVNFLNRYKTFSNYRKDVFLKLKYIALNKFT